MNKWTNSQKDDHENDKKQNNFDTDDINASLYKS